MAAQGTGSTKAKKNTRTGCGCLTFIVIVVIVVIAVAAGSGGKSSPEKEAREYIKEKTFQIDKVRASVEDVEVVLGGVIKNNGGSTTEIDELASDAEKAHDGINEVRNELYKLGGNEELSNATLALQEGANELKNAMGALVAYTGNPNPASLAHLNSQYEKGKEKWNEGAEKVWSIAKESGAPKL